MSKQCDIGDRSRRLYRVSCCATPVVGRPHGRRPRYRQRLLRSEAEGRTPRPPEASTQFHLCEARPRRSSGNKVTIRKAPLSRGQIIIGFFVGEGPAKPPRLVTLKYKTLILLSNSRPPLKLANKVRSLFQRVMLSGDRLPIAVGADCCWNSNLRLVIQTWGTS